MGADPQECQFQGIDAIPFQDRVRMVLDEEFAPPQEPNSMSPSRFLDIVSCDYDGHVFFFRQTNQMFPDSVDEDIKITVHVSEMTEMIESTSRQVSEKQRLVETIMFPLQVREGGIIMKRQMDHGL